MTGLVIVVIVVIVAAIAVVIAGYYWSETQKIRRALRQAPRTSIAAAAEGAVVRLDGRVAPGESLVAPLTGRRCVFYVAIVEQWVSNGKSGSWRQRVKEQRGIPFTVDDGTGHAIIDPSGARLDVEIDSTTKSGTFDDATSVEDAFLDRHGMKSEGWIFNKSLRYREGVIEIGETIAIAGQAVREPDPSAAARAAGYRDGLATRLRLGGSDRQRLLLSDARDLTQR